MTLGPAYGGGGGGGAADGFAGVLNPGRELYTHGSETLAGSSRFSLAVADEVPHLEVRGASSWGDIGTVLTEDLILSEDLGIVFDLSGSIVSANHL